MNVNSRKAACDFLIDLLAWMQSELRQRDSCCRGAALPGWSTSPSPPNSPLTPGFSSCPSLLPSSSISPPAPHSSQSPPSQSRAAPTSYQCPPTPQRLVTPRTCSSGTVSPRVWQIFYFNCEPFLFQAGSIVHYQHAHVQDVSTEWFLFLFRLKETSQVDQVGTDMLCPGTAATVHQHEKIPLEKSLTATFMVRHQTRWSNALSQAMEI